MEYNLEHLISILKDISGHKVITLSNFEEKQGWEYNLIDDGTIGTDLSSELLFKQQILNAMDSGGILVIRQITRIKNKGVAINRICGVSLKFNKWNVISADEMELAHRIDAETLRIKDKEKNVVFFRFDI